MRIAPIIDIRRLLVEQALARFLEALPSRLAVSENYDYRCAASGWRIILPEGRVMVEAAHLIPYDNNLRS